jgi:hypothetical protein
MNELRAFYLREAKREWRAKRRKKWLHEFYVFLVACALIAAVAWAVGTGR